MNSSGNSITNCRFCRYYSPEGRRGGSCERLDVPVDSTWEACKLAVHPFEAWQTFELSQFIHQEPLKENIAIAQLVMS